MISDSLPGITRRCVPSVSRFGQRCVTLSLSSCVIRSRWPKRIVRPVSSARWPPATRELHPRAPGLSSAESPRQVRPPGDLALSERPFASGVAAGSAEIIDTGWDYRVVVVDDHLVFRLPRSDTYADRVAVEVRLLRACVTGCRFGFPSLSMFPWIRLCWDTCSSSFGEGDR